MSPAVVHQDVSDTYDIGTIPTRPPSASQYLNQNQNQN